MQFIITANDGENRLEKRMAVRPRHLEGMAKLGEHIICAAGLLDDEGKMKVLSSFLTSRIVPLWMII